MGRDHGPEALRSALKDLSAKAVRDLAQAAGLRVRTDGNVTWLRSDELRAAVLEHLAPQRSAAPEEFARFALSCGSCSVLNFRNSMVILKGFSG